MKTAIIGIFAALSISSVAYAATVVVVTSNNATISSSADIALLDYGSITTGLTGNDEAYINLPEGSEGQVIEVKVKNQTNQDHNVILQPSGTDDLESDAGLDTMTSQGAARRLFFKGGKWYYLTYM